MADSFFGFDTSLSNLNDDEGGGGPSEDEYDALNDETFGQDSDAFDWEVEHEQLAEQLESSRRYRKPVVTAHPPHNLEASLSQLVLDDSDTPSRMLSSNVWRHDLPIAPTPVPTLKNVCTVEEIERQLRQNQQPPNFQQHQNFFQPRFPPVILQRPPGLQAPVPLPFAPQQNMQMGQMNQPLNKVIGQNMGQNNMMPNQMGHNVNQMGQMNQMGQNMNQMGQMNQIGQNMNQMGQNMNQMGPNVNQFMQNANQMGNFQNNQMGQGNMMNLAQNMQQHQMNQMGQNVNQMGQNMNQMGQNQMPQNMNQMGQGMNQMGQSMNQMGQSMNQMGQNVNQMIPNGNQFNPGMGQFPHMMGQPRMMAPPPGMNMPRQNFSPNMGQFNHNFRGPSMPTKPPDQPMSQPNMGINEIMSQQIKNQSTHINQKQVPITNQIGSQTPLKNQNQTPNQRQDQKLQKSRVYNNSSQKNMTSQNLVQLIQNTHPMLQFNNSFHNANHHPMLNRTQFNQFNQAFNNQRVNGTYNDNNRNSINGDDSCSRDTDEYAGLMTSREKQWLINIQLLQLSSGTPYIHDFYYTVFLERQASKEKEGVKEAHKANQQNHPFYSGAVTKQEQHSRERHNSVRHNSNSEDAATPRVYAPAQFENSLGKLQCGSVTAPRKIIDVEVVGGDSGTPRQERAPSVASTTNPAEIPREIRRTKQLLLDIEALYLILLRLEELNDPLAISNALILKEREEKQKQLEQAQKEALENEQEEDSNVFLRNIESVQRRPKQDSPKSESIDKRQVVNLAVSQKPPVKNLLDEDKDDLINKMFTGLLHGDRVQQMMAVRKGRTLLSRFMSRVPALHPCGRGVWQRVLRALPSAARRDPALPHLPHALHTQFALYIQSTSGWSAVLESCSLLAEAFDPARTPYALTCSFTLSCVCALIEKASLLVNTPDATSNERQWYKFLKTLARALKKTTLTVAKPVKLLSENKLLHHLKQLDSRSTIEILQRGKSAEFADISKADVSEQLVKHLC